MLPPRAVASTVSGLRVTLYNFLSCFFWQLWFLLKLCSRYIILYDEHIYESLGKVEYHNTRIHIYNNNAISFQSSRYESTYPDHLTFQILTFVREKLNSVYYSENWKYIFHDIFQQSNFFSWFLCRTISLLDCSSYVFICSVFQDFIISTSRSTLCCQYVVLSSVPVKSYH